MKAQHSGRLGRSAGGNARTPWEVRRPGHGPGKEREQSGDRGIGKVRSVIEPTSNRSSGCSRRATSIIAGEKVDAESIETQLTQVRGDVSRSAAHVRHRTSAGGTNQLGEQCQRGSDIRHLAQRPAQLAGVAVCDSVIGGSSISPASRRYPPPAR